MFTPLDQIKRWDSIRQSPPQLDTSKKNLKNLKCKIQIVVIAFCQWIVKGNTPLQNWLRCGNHSSIIVRASGNVHCADTTQMYWHKYFWSWASVSCLWCGDNSGCFWRQSLITRRMNMKRSLFPAVNTHAIISFKRITVSKQSREHDKQIWGCTFVK